MNIAVIGAGTIGSILAGMLARAGAYVTMIGRPRQISRLKAKGLLIQSSQGKHSYHIPARTSLQNEHDLVIFAIPMHDLEQAYQDNYPYLEAGLMMTVQNGVQGANLLSCHFEPDNIVESAVFFEAEKAGPARFTLRRPGAVLIGKPFCPNDEQVSQFADLLRPCLDVHITSHIMAVKWLKLLSDYIYCLPAITGLPLGRLYADLNMRRLFISLLREALQIVQTAGIPLAALPDLNVEELVQFGNLPYQSAVIIMPDIFLRNRDLDSFGYLFDQIMHRRQSEVDFINGEVMQVAHSLRMAAPLNRLFVNVAHDIEACGRCMSPQTVLNTFSRLAHFDQ